ncbi:PREDICTED: uncharacterized protein LOC106812934 [Priapulus caudatus]|uniref:Uncharacterized protein LOC106812934 n=1 Tax=Priapulus caudatus TaxID=37621 RepID=A0ABM1EJQ9_PRICU|nr:PREDICTED: uncharacterized protein LOC106812934 [Priapulus caudatus]
MPGIVLGVVIFVTVREPSRLSTGESEPSYRGTSDSDGWGTRLWVVVTAFVRPSTLLLCLAGSVRNAAGYVWAYNTQPYFESVGQTPLEIAKYMSWLPLVAGSIGVVFGGCISDQVVKRRGLYTRVWVLVISQLVAAPFAAGALFLNVPWSYLSLIPTYIIGEMWVAVTLTVLVELLPASVRTSGVATYFFIISNVGGNMPLLVPPLQTAFTNAGYSQIDSLRGALYVLYPGLYVAGSILFLITLLSLRRDVAHVARTTDFVRLSQSASSLASDDSAAAPDVGHSSVATATVSDHEEGLIVTAMDNGMGGDEGRGVGWAQ